MSYRVKSVINHKLPVKFKKQVALFHRLTFLYALPKALAVQLDRIDSYMDKQLHAIGAEPQRVTSIGEHFYFTVAGRVQLSAVGNYADAFSEGLGRKYLVVNVCNRNYLSAYRSV